MNMKQTLRPLALVGAAFAIMVASPYTLAHAYDGRPGPRPMYEDQQLRQTYQKVGFSHRLQAMVADGKITRDQALRLQKLMAKEEERQQRSHRRFVESLPEKTGISEDTLRELFAPPRHDGRHGHWDD